MVFRSVSETQTPPLSPPPQSPPSPPPVVSAASFYLKPQTTPSMPSFSLSNSLRWNMNMSQYQPSFRPSYSGLNPVLRFGSPPNRAENLSSALLRLGSEENRRSSSPVLRLGSDRSENDANSELELEPVEPASEEPVEKKDKEPAGKGKSKLSIRFPVKTKESGDNSDAGDGDCDGEGEGEGDEEDEDEEAEAEFSYEEEEPTFPFVKTWNLRPRKPLMKPPNPGNNGGGGGGGGGSRSCPPPAKKPRPAPRARPRPRPRPRAEEKASATAPEAAPSEQKRPAFSVSLVKEEIEEDFMKLTGAKPSKKPLKRPRAVQKQLDVCFPGLWLNAVTPDLYKVPDPPLKG